MSVTVRSCIVVALVLLSQHFVVDVQSESVWHQLQDHSTASHVKRQQQKSGNEVYKYPQLFKESTVAATKVPSPSSSSSVDAALPAAATTTTTTTTRTGMNMLMSMNKMMMTTTTTAPVSTPSSIGNTTSAPILAISKQPSIAKSKKSLSPTISNAPSVADASFTPTVGVGKMKTMRMSMMKSKSTTPSPSVSAQPTYIDDDGALASYSPTIVKVVDGKGMMMMIMSKARKESYPTLSPSISAEPTYIEESNYPTMADAVNKRKGMGGPMSKDKASTPSLSISAEPTYIDDDSASFFPTMVDGKKMGNLMSKDKKDTATSPSPSISAEPTSIDGNAESFFPTMQVDSKGGMMSMSTMTMMMSKRDQTFSPTASLVPSTTVVPTFSNSKGGGMMMGMSMGMSENQSMMMMMKKDKEDNPKMNMSKMTLPPVPTLPETTVPTTAPNLLPNGTYELFCFHSVSK
jgi:hypothetical protein